MRKKGLQGKGGETCRPCATAEAGEGLAVRGERVRLRRFVECGLGHDYLLGGAFRFSGIMHAERKRQR